LGIVGTCALQKTGERSFELTKMGVRESARGLKAGEFLLKAVLERAMAMGAEPLYLLSNKRCAAAVHLYEKLGFEHDAGIMARYGARYARCDVAMQYRPDVRPDARPGNAA
jgi:N-acetylglutamate synthase-like GNAT family acetyltransferase